VAARRTRAASASCCFFAAAATLPEGECERQTVRVSNLLGLKQNTFTRHVKDYRAKAAPAAVEVESDLVVRGDVGDDDVANETVGVNPRGGEVIRDVKFADFVKQLQDETADATEMVL
jgi:hypothetical protein